MKFSRRKQKSSKHLMVSALILSILFPALAVAQAEPMQGNNGESFPWLIIPILLVLIVAVLFWFGRGIFGGAGCSSGTVRRRVFIGASFPAVAQSPASYENSGLALKTLRSFPWVTFDVPVAVLGPEVTDVVQRKVKTAKVYHQIKNATREIEKYDQASHGVDIVAKLTCEICAPALIHGTYWKKETQTITLSPKDVNESHDGTTGNRGWSQKLVQDHKWLSAKLPEIVEASLTLSGQGAKQGSV